MDSWAAVSREAYRRLLGEGIEAGDEVKARKKKGGAFSKRSFDRKKALRELLDGGV